MRALLLPILLLLPTVWLHAQNAPAVGFLRFVNTVTLEGRLDIALDGQSLRKAGFRAGDMTGGFGLAEGSHPFILKHPACEPMEKEMAVAPGTTTTYFVTWEETKGKGKKENEIIRRLKFVELQGRQNDRKSGIDLVSMCRQPLLQFRLAFNNRPIGDARYLKPGQCESSPIPGPGEIRVAAGDTLVSVFTLEEPGHWCIVVFDDPAAKGTVRAVYFPTEAMEVGG